MEHNIIAYAPALLEHLIILLLTCASKACSLENESLSPVDIELETDGASSESKLRRRVFYFAAL